MTREEWQRVKAITASALALPDSERDAFVAAHCADAELRHQVESLLTAAVAATDLFESPVLTTGGAQAVLAATESQLESFVGRRIGPYHVLGELGRGGMGTAYLAERVDQAYRKRVAIKLIKRGMDTDAIVRRFLHERQILADLSHPNIATLLDGGTTDDGRPYFIMEYIEGLPIDAYCEQKGLSIAERLTLFRAVCDAVHHAHENRVIHRDLKPSNILVTQAGVPKLLDFGIAKVLDPVEGHHTGDGTLLARAMTLQYASPEQVRGAPITAASDVYSLGVLLYELLTGRPPYQFADCTRHEAERLVSEEMPPPPSRVVGDDAGRPSGEGSAVVRRQLAGNLDAITLTALRKEPERRYATAAALADDIERHLDGRPIAARPDSARARFVSFVRRRQILWPAAALFALIASLAIGIISYRGATGADAPIASIAVLPLVTSSEDADLEYLSDGVTESIINRLSRLSRVRVIARDSVYRYKGKMVDPREVGRDLDVEAVLTGRVARRDDGLTISVELVDTRDRRQLWGQQYRRRVSDMQVLEANLAQQIAGSLRLQLTREEQARFDQNDNRDPEAYELYLRGRYFWNKRTTTDLRRSIDYFKQAVAKDPEFALAYSGLADSLSLLTEYHGALAKETYGEASRAARRALEIDDQLAEAHTSLAYIRQFYEWDWNGAELAYQRALELNPRYATAHQWYAEFLSAMGRHDEALAEIDLAAAGDPLSLIVNAVEANLLYMARRYDEAIEQCLEVIDMDPNFPEVYEYLKRSFDQKGSYREATAARQTRRRLLRLDASETPALRTAASTTSRTMYWQKRLEQELAEGQTEGLQPFEMAEILAQAGDRVRALEWLERACADSDFMTMYLRVAPNLDPLRAEPRFQAMLARGCRVQAARIGGA